jgi:peptide/nickel transport system substrate-binding protein
MKQEFRTNIQRIALGFLLLLPAQMTIAQPQHGIAMYGEPALPPDFVSLPYANPQAPKGGKIVFGEAGSYDSLNPYIVKGQTPAGVGLLTVETLLGRNYDEPFALYGVLAESVETDDARTWVQFTLREAARFSDGTPVTVEDVIWSFEKLGTEGSPRYAGAWKKIAKSEKLGERVVKFTFAEVDRELPLILGLRPILKKADWDGKAFQDTTLVPLVGSGPYVVSTFEAGKFISFTRNPNWWGADLNFYQGMHNFDEVRYEYFGDGDITFEAFKAGETTSFRESNPAKWETNYDFPRMASGDVIKSVIPHQRPSGIEGFVFNTRKPVFENWHVRDALIHAFNFELINQTLNGGVNPRITSYFSNSELSGAMDQPASPEVAALLAPFASELLVGAIEGYALPVSDGSEANRNNIRTALEILETEGWSVKEGVLSNAAGEPFAFEILLVNGATDTINAASIYVEALKRLGIDAKITTVDSAQYKERTTNYDFDMTYYTRSLSLSPGNEQMLYWGAAGVTEPGTRNYMGMNSPAAEAMIKAMLTTTKKADFVFATQALDRILTSGRYVIPMGYSNVSRLAHAKQLAFPTALPMYGDWLGFQPEVWWFQE